MSKAPANKGKIVFFILGATVGNIVLMTLSFVALMALYSLLLSKVLPSGALIWAIAIAFLLSLVLSTLVYRRVLKFLRDRYHLDEYLGIKPH
jgi:membrane protein implicated in regulation of membrane protease activity